MSMKTAEYGLEVAMTMKAKTKDIDQKVNSVTAKAEKLRKAFRLSADFIRPKAQMKDLGKETEKAAADVEKLEKKLKAMRTANIDSKPYKELSAKMRQTRDEAAKMEARLKYLKGLSFQSPQTVSEINSLEKGLARAKKGYQDLAAQRMQVEKTGGTERGWQEYQSLTQQLEQARGRLAAFQAQARIPIGQRLVGSAPASLREFGGLLQAIGLRAKAIASPVGRFGVVAATAFKKAVGWAKKLASGFGKVFAKIPLLNKFSGALSKIKRGLKMGTGIKGLARLGFAGATVYAAVRMMREGFSNLADYSDRTAANINMLRGSLLTLKNALATAFAPIFNAIAPALQKLIGWLSSAATAIAHFTAAFTGQSTVVVAKDMGAASFGEAADAAGGATDAAKKYQKTLLGFDQINKLEEQSSSSGAGGSGGGGGGAGGGDMFETVQVGSKAKKLADRIKEAWGNGDFFDLGLDLGTRIANWLAGIPWKKIHNTAARLGSSLATGFNGLNSSEFWTELGGAIANGLNTAIEFAYAFVTKFDFKKFGTAIGNGINKFVRTFKWKKLAKTISNGIKGALDGLNSLLRTINWKQIGKKIGTFIINIDWVGIAKKAVQTLVSAMKGAVDLFKGFTDTVIPAIEKWLKNGGISDLLSFAGKAVIDIAGVGWDLVETLAKWVKEGVSISLKVFWELIKKGAEALGNLYGGTSETGAKTAGGKSTFVSPWAEPTETTVTITAKGKTDKSFTDTKAKYDAMKTTAATKSAYGSQDKSFLKMRARFLAIKKSSATKTAYGAQSSFFGKLHKRFMDFKDSTATKTVKGKQADSFTFAKEAYQAIVTKTVMVTLKGNKALKVINQGKAVWVETQADGGLYRGGSWKPITAAAGGGYFGGGQLFIAREAGPELVGRMPGGGSGVVNNDQIVASVSAGVYKAVAAAMQNGGQAVNVYLQGDAGTFFKVMQKEATQYVNATGQSPFPA